MRYDSKIMHFSDDISLMWLLRNGDENRCFYEKIFQMRNKYFNSGFDTTVSRGIIPTKNGKVKIGFTDHDGWKDVYFGIGSLELIDDYRFGRAHFQTQEITSESYSNNVLNSFHLRDVESGRYAAYIKMSHDGTWLHQHRVVLAQKDVKDIIREGNKRLGFKPNEFEDLMKRIDEERSLAFLKPIVELK